MSNEEDRLRDIRAQTSAMSASILLLGILSALAIAVPIGAIAWL